jgi:hypothetical protein
MNVAQDNKIVRKWQEPYLVSRVKTESEIAVGVK